MCPILSIEWTVCDADYGREVGAGARATTCGLSGEDFVGAAFEGAFGGTLLEEENELLADFDLQGIDTDGDEEDGEEEDEEESKWMEKGGKGAGRDWSGARVGWQGEGKLTQSSTTLILPNREEEIAPTHLLYHCVGCRTALRLRARSARVKPVVHFLPRFQFEQRRRRLVHPHRGRN